MLPSSLGPESSEMDRKTVETCSLVRRVHIWACIWEKWMSDSTCQRWKGPSRLLPTKSAKTSLFNGMGVQQCPWHGWSAYMWRYHWCKGLCWNFGETYAVIKAMTFPRNSMCISAGQCQVSFCMRNNIVAWLHRHSAWLTCLQSRYVSYWKCMVHHEEENQTTVTKDC